MDYMDSSNPLPPSAPPPPNEQSDAAISNPSQVTASSSVPSSAHQRTLVLTTQQSAALTKHLIMQQQQQQLDYESTHHTVQPSSGAQFYTAAASHPTPHFLDQRRPLPLSIDEPDDDEPLVIHEHPYDDVDDEDDAAAAADNDNAVDDDADDRQPQQLSRNMFDDEPNPSPPNFMPQLVIQRPHHHHHSSTFRAQSPSPATSSSAVVIANQPLSPPHTFYGRLTYKDAVLYISDHLTQIGRNSTTSTVHFHVGKNSFVSRKHLQLLHDTDKCEFYLVCLSKNGVFVDDTFQRKTSQPMRLPRTCTFRFPSTVIRIIFESLYTTAFRDADQANASGAENHKPTPPPAILYTPLKITIPAPAVDNALLVEPSSLLGGDVGPHQQQHQQQRHVAQHVSVVTNTANAMLAVMAAAATTATEHNAGTNALGGSVRFKIKSPFPSPTGTISAANSCPTSPRHHATSFHHDNYIGYTSAAASRSNAAKVGAGCPDVSFAFLRHNHKT